MSQGVMGHKKLNKATQLFSATDKATTWKCTEPMDNTGSDDTPDETPNDTPSVAPEDTDVVRFILAID